MRLPPWVLVFPPGLALLAYFSLAGLVFYRAARSRLRATFLLFLLSMGIWSFGSMMMRLDPSRIKYWNMLLMIGGPVAMPLALFTFVQDFLDHRRTRLLWVGLILALALAVATAAGYMLEDVGLTSAGQIVFGYGSLVPIHAPYWIFLLGYSFASLIQAYRRAMDPIVRNRIRYLLIAMGFIFLGSLTNVFSSLRAFPIDHAANMISACLIAYAVLRYQLVDVVLVIRKGLLYFIPTSIIGATYFLIISTTMRLFEAFTGFQVFMASLPRDGWTGFSFARDMIPS